MATLMDDTALLAAIRAEPDDDTVRLAYADWLEENGQPERADFIRCQVRGLEVGPDARNGALTALPTRLWNGTRVEWVGNAVAAIFSGRGDAESVIAEVQFSRGFVRVVTCGLKTWLDIGDEILASNPTLARVLIDTVPLWREALIQRWPGLDFRYIDTLTGITTDDIP
jgi:uncharacterized protein (TIGR02996 family)